MSKRLSASSQVWRAVDELFRDGDSITHLPQLSGDKTLRRHKPWIAP
jgi:hypothetical protein